MSFDSFYLYLSVQFDHANFGKFSDLCFNLEIFVFSAVIFASSISSEIPIERLTFYSCNYFVLKEKSATKDPG